jgi:hypothetical protein
MSNLNQYLRNGDSRYLTVKNKVRALASNIPEYNLSDLRESHATVSSHLITEMEDIFNAANRYDVVTSGDHWEKEFDNCSLKKLSAYRMIQRWMAHPIGLAAEVWVEKQNFQCPVCHERCLRLSGGSSAAWADLHCSKCKNVFIELKTKWNKALNRIKREKKMTAGSHRWYKAQERAGVQHYMVIVPKDGGTVHQFKITNATHTIDNKFCAYYNSAPEYATLRTFLRLDDNKTIGTSLRYEMEALEDEGRTVVNKWIGVKFGHYARRIQRAYRKV